MEVLAQRSQGHIEYCDSHKTYFVPSVTNRGQKALNNSKIIAHSQQFKNERGMYDFLYIEEIVCQSFADYFLLEALSNQASQFIYQAQRKVNRNVYRKSRFNSLLSLKLEVEKKLYFYRRLYKELNTLSLTEEILKYKFSEYKNCFTNAFDKKDPEFIRFYEFENMYKGMRYNIKDNFTLMESIYSHFDENAKITESRYNYRIVKWTFIVGVVSLLATILLAGDPCLFDQICDFIIELFKKK